MNQKIDPSLLLIISSQLSSCILRNRLLTARNIPSWSSSARNIARLSVCDELQFFESLDQLTFDAVSMLCHKKEEQICNMQHC